MLLQESFDKVLESTTTTTTSTTTTTTSTTTTTATTTTTTAGSTFSSSRDNLLNQMQEVKSSRSYELNEFEPRCWPASHVWIASRIGSNSLYSASGPRSSHKFWNLVPVNRISDSEIINTEIINTEIINTTQNLIQRS